MPVLISPISFDIESLADLEPLDKAYRCDPSWTLQKLDVQTHHSRFFKFDDEQPEVLVLEESCGKLDITELDEHPPDHAGEGWLLDKQQLVEPEEQLLLEGLDSQKITHRAGGHADKAPSARSTPREPQLLAVCLLMVGKSSPWFRWSERKGSFEAVQQVAFSDSSQTQDLLKNVLQLGALFRQLKHVPITSSVTHAAFKSCVEECLATVEEWLSSAQIVPTDLFQACHRIRAVIDSVWQIHSEITELEDDGAVVSTLSTLKDRYSQISSKLATFVSAVVADIYKPWLEQLLHWISAGTGKDDEIHLLAPNLFPADIVDLIRKAKSNTDFSRTFVPAFELPPLVLPPLTPTGQPEATKGSDKIGQLIPECHAWSAFTGPRLDASFELLPEIEPGPTSPPYMVALHDLLNGHAGVQTSIANNLITIVSSTISQYAQATSTAVLHHLHKTFDLTSHLQSRYQYFLCGNADFTGHIRSAIFGNMDDNDSLDLNGLNTAWPPRTSRLSLALLSIVGSSTTASFVIKQLPEDEMQRACDPLSIHALDILQLKVETPAALLFLASSDYDEIFAALLLDMRMLHLVTKLRRSKSRVPLAVNQMFHVVATISSHFMQLVVEETWSGFLHDVSVSASIEEIERAHLHCLLRIRSGLFLRTRQLAIRRAIEDFYAVILHFRVQTRAGGLDKLTEAASHFEQSLRSHIQMSSGKAEAETEWLKILLGRLAPGSEHDLGDRRGS